MVDNSIFILFYFIVVFATFTSAPPGGSQSIPKSERIHNPSRDIWLSSQWDVPRKPPEGGTQVAPETPQLTWRSSGSTLELPVDDKAPYI